MTRELAVGSDSFIWNGHTLVEANTRMICFGASSLMETSDNIRKAQYYNLLAWSWERMSRDREEKIMLYADEAYILVDPYGLRENKFLIWFLVKKYRNFIIRGGLSQMLSLPEDCDYTLKGLSHINWQQGQDDKGKTNAIEYTI